MRLFLCLAPLSSVLMAGCGSETACSALYQSFDMTYEATLPPAVDPATDTLEVCIGDPCDTVSISKSGDERICQAVGITTHSTVCTFDPATRKVSFTSNPSSGTSLVVTGISPSGTRTQVLVGTVRYRTVESGGCTAGAQGTFTPSP